MDLFDHLHYSEILLFGFFGLTAQVELVFSVAFSLLAVEGHRQGEPFDA